MALLGPGAGSVRVRVTRDLGLFDVTMAAVGAMVGAAIFLLVGATYTVAGPFVLLSLGMPPAGRTSGCGARCRRRRDS